MVILGSHDTNHRGYHRRFFDRFLLLGRAFVILFRRQPLHPGSWHRNRLRPVLRRHSGREPVSDGSLCVQQQRSFINHRIRHYRGHSRPTTHLSRLSPNSSSPSSSSASSNWLRLSGSPSLNTSSSKFRTGDVSAPPKPASSKGSGLLTSL